MPTARNITPRLGRFAIAARAMGHADYVGRQCIRKRIEEAFG